MRLSLEVALHSSGFDLESFLGLFLCYGADAKTDSDPEVSLVNEQSAVREDGDAWCEGEIIQGSGAGGGGARVAPSASNCLCVQPAA